jgi:peroxiredoxin
MSQVINFEGTKVPNVTFKTRQKNASGDFEWVDLTTNEIFNGKKVVVFSLPGAFTPTCSSTHLPGYEANFDELQEHGIDAVYCLSVNDTFVMNAWFKDQNIENVKPLPDGNADFTRKMGMLVKKENLGFGMRSWRYSMVVNDGIVEKAFIEDNYSDNCESDPFEVSDVNTIIDYLESTK